MWRFLMPKRRIWICNNDHEWHSIASALDIASIDWHTRCINVRHKYHKISMIRASDYTLLVTRRMEFFLNGLWGEWTSEIIFSMQTAFRAAPQWHNLRIRIFSQLAHWFDCKMNINNKLCVTVVCATCIVHAIKSIMFGSGSVVSCMKLAIHLASNSNRTIVINRCPCGTKAKSGTNQTSIESESVWILFSMKNENCACDIPAILSRAFICCKRTRMQTEKCSSGNGKEPFSIAILITV